MDVEADGIIQGERYPVFSEAFLYPKMTKGDARFILAIAEEYDALRQMLGEKTLKCLFHLWKVISHAKSSVEYDTRFYDSIKVHVSWEATVNGRT